MEPIFKESFDIMQADFAHYPFWVWCEMEDADQPWYEGVSPSTFRAFTGQLPISGRAGLCKTKVSFNNGQACEGFAFLDGYHLLSPNLFIEGQRIPLEFKDLDGEHIQLQSAVELLIQAFGGPLAELFPILVRPDADVTRDAPTLAVEYLKSISVHKDSLVVRRLPEQNG